MNDHRLSPFAEGEAWEEALLRVRAYFQTLRFQDPQLLEGVSRQALYRAWERSSGAPGESPVTATMAEAHQMLQRWTVLSTKGLGLDSCPLRFARWFGQLSSGAQDRVVSAGSSPSSVPRPEEGEGVGEGRLPNGIPPPDLMAMEPEPLRWSFLGDLLPFLTSWHPSASRFCTKQHPAD
ncbi:MAG: hypothetical protein AAF191_04110 [Verrucomicrobiota bacterium]